MENAPVIDISFIDYAPGVEPELRERSRQWVREVHIPVLMKNEGRIGTDSYRVLRESPEYPQSGSIAQARLQSSDGPRLRIVRNWLAYRPY